MSNKITRERKTEKKVKNTTLNQETKEENENREYYEIDGIKYLHTIIISSRGRGREYAEEKRRKKQSNKSIKEH